MSELKKCVESKRDGLILVQELQSSLEVAVNELQAELKGRSVGKKYKELKSFGDRVREQIKK